MAARKALNAQGKREVDTRAIIRTAVAQRELVDARDKDNRTNPTFRR